ncbi:MAG: DegT/DnrJ/EryC1/StrS family aminotransferase [Saprospiraceae bacterium]
MNKIQMVDLQAQYQRIKAEVDQGIGDILNSCQFINGTAVKEFTKNLKTYLGAQHVIPCGNGTDALQIALMALDLQPGDEVITTPFTFVATAEVIALLKLKPVFVDVHADTFNMDETKLEAVITERTKCIIPVHLFGQCCNMEKIMQIAEAHQLYVVEDNAQAIGADYHFSDGRICKSGTMGHIGTTSFFPSKNLGCYGDGGAIFTQDDALGKKIQVIANHGSSVRYYHDEIGVNSRLDSIQAAVLDVKLKHLDDYGRARKKGADFYNAHLGLPGIQTPVIAPFSTHVFHQYTLIIENGRDQVKEHLTEKGIPTGVYYPVPLHLQKAYRGDGYKMGDFPVSEDLARKVLSLPMHTELKEEIQHYIIDEIKNAILASVKS